MKKAIFLYDFTGIAAKPWLDAGYQCWLFDGQHTPGVTPDPQNINLIRVGMWFYPDKVADHAAMIHLLVGEGVELVASFPECTDMAVSGARHFKAKAEKDPLFQEKAAQLARLGEAVGNLYGCPWYAENPVSVLSSLWRKPDFSFQPYEYGGYLPPEDEHPDYPAYIAPRDAYPKKTNIWCGNGFSKPPARPVEPVPGYAAQYKQLGGKSTKTKNIRSATPRGWSLAVFEGRTQPDQE